MNKFFFLILGLLSFAMSACYTPMPQRRGESFVAAYNRGMAYKPAGFYAGDTGNTPTGCSQDNPRCARIVNRTSDMFARCWMDGRELVPPGKTPADALPILEGGEARPAMLLAPGEEIAVVVDGTHDLRCRLYAMPAPLKAVYEKIDGRFAPSTYYAAVFKLEPLWMRRLPPGAL